MPKKCKIFNRLQNEPTVTVIAVSALLISSILGVVIIISLLTLTFSI